jgi:molybdopterin converting factor subunit 1
MNATNRAIEVRMFGQARELTGHSAVVVEAPGLTAQSLLSHLAERHPELLELLPRCAVAVNQRFARGEEPIVPGDEVALIPPVAGG